MCIVQCLKQLGNVGGKTKSCCLAGSKLAASQALVAILSIRTREAFPRMHSEMRWSNSFIIIIFLLGYVGLVCMSDTCNSQF